MSVTPAWGKAASPGWRMYQLSSAKNSASRLAIRNSVCGKMCCSVQKKSTPLRKPRNSGGSPSGVSEPPALDTMKMKNTTICAVCLRPWFARISGRISSIDAPVVPMKLASTAPTARMPTLSAGVPRRLPRM
ncbi:hypothetical protein D3C71_1817030 [compost metagenome]